MEEETGEMTATIQKVERKETKTGKPIYVVTVTHDGKREYVRGYGSPNPEWKPGDSINFQYRVNSEGFLWILDAKNKTKQSQPRIESTGFLELVQEQNKPKLLVGKTIKVWSGGRDGGMSREYPLAITLPIDSKDVTQEKILELAKLLDTSIKAMMREDGIGVNP